MSATQAEINSDTQQSGNKPLVAALKGQVQNRPPFWFMRQAGRYLPEYMELRAEAGGFLDMVYNPDFAAEVTVQPIRRFNMDAAILFSDILVIPHALGQKLEFVKGEGPKLDPIRNAKQLGKLAKYGEVSIHETLNPIYETVSNVRSMLSREGYQDTALIGFAGAPWTVACYMVDGQGSKDFQHTKKWAYSDPEGFDRLIDILVTSSADYLIAQIEAGAEAIKIFDSWAGIVDENLFEKYIIAPAQKIVSLVKQKHPDIPVIGFARGAGVQNIRYVQETKIDGIATDQMTPVKWIKDNLQPLATVQGNLDPYCLLAGGKALEISALNILENLSGAPFIFNLGHGINKETPSEHVAQLSQIIHNFKN